MVCCNEVNTSLSTETFNSFSENIRYELSDVLDKIILVQRMIDPNREKAIDKEKDNLGRVIVDITNPHILENMDYFRLPAIHFKEFGKFTNAYPNQHPNSDYVKFWKQETRYCIDGKVRNSDGEWVTGYHYFYLNFSPIQLTEDKLAPSQKKTSKNTQADRVQDFPAIWDGDYLYYHYLEKAENNGEYGTVLKTRGRGFSFKGGSMTGRNMECIKQSRTFLMASETEYLNKDGIWNKFNDVLDFCAEHTEWPTGRLKDDQNKMHIRLGYKHSETSNPTGVKSEAFGVTLKDAPQKARGKRGKLIQWEEAGKFPGLLKAWSIARMSLEDGRSVFGLMVAFGTGGTVGADFEALEKLFYSPRGYRVHALPNVFDKVAGKGECAFFFPEYLNRKHCYDKDGNSDVIKALIEILEDREDIRKGTDDPTALTQEKADRPITPQEAVMRTEGNKFPVTQLKDYLEDIMPTIDVFWAEHLYGQLIQTGEREVVLKQDVGHVIREFPIKDKTRVAGATEIFELPKKVKKSDGSEYTPSGRYIGGIDTYDDDTGTSLGSIFILDLWTDRIVAEYTGRPNTADDFYETCANLLLFYRATANYENNKKGLFGWFRNHHLLHLLCDTPQILKDMDLVKAQEAFGNKAKGTNATLPINNWALNLQVGWMKGNAYTEEALEQIEELDESADLKEILLPKRLRTIRSVPYIKECIAFNEDGNFDRISAMGMLMIYREDRQLYIGSHTGQEEDDLTNDEFFNRNYEVSNEAGENYFDRTDYSDKKSNNISTFVDIDQFNLEDYLN